jgi:intracellular septation protein A
MNEEQRTKVPVSLITTMEKHLAFLFFFYGIFMGYTAIKMSTDQWLFFKTIGFYIAFVIFMVGEFAYLRFKRA